MESPIRSVRYIHKAIRVELETLEDAVRRLNPADDRPAADIERRFSFLYDTVKAHEDGEEDAVFPAMDERIYPVSAPYLLDHKVDQRHMWEIAQSLSRFGATPGAGERTDLLHHLNRLTVILYSAMALHIRKEEEILVPLIEQHFSIEEQANIVNRAIAHFSPDQMQQVLPWMLKALTLDEQEAYLRELMQAMPPEAFHAMTRAVSEGVSPQQWQEITRRMPEAA
ncbi:MAG: hemerythrin domain-containing protein [Dehalococcoidia bacterium]|jgi:zinc finger-like protein